MRNTIFSVPEIHCAHCKTSIEGALGPVTGVRGASVDVEARTVSVHYEPDIISPDLLTGLIEEQGYDVERRDEVS